MKLVLQDGVRVGTQSSPPPPISVKPVSSRVEDKGSTSSSPVAVKVALHLLPQTDHSRSSSAPVRNIDTAVNFARLLVGKMQVASFGPLVLIRNRL